MGSNNLAGSSARRLRYARELRALLHANARAVGWKISRVRSRLEAFRRHGGRKGYYAFPQTEEMITHDCVVQRVGESDSIHGTWIDPKAKVADQENPRQSLH